MEIHKLPMRFRTHAALRLIEHFDMSLDEVKHYFKTGKLVKRPAKDGDIGILERTVGKSKIRFVFTIRQKTIWIITVEGGGEHD
ncbi:MAG: DUF4258 domain-containing protein [Thermoplasmata archaeon]